MQETKKATSISVNSTLSTLLGEPEQLCPEQFTLPYKGYIVNLNSISSISKDVITLRCNRTIPIPRRKFQALQDIYMNFLFRNREKGLL